MHFFDALRLVLFVMLLGGGVFFIFYLKGFFILHPIKTLKECFRKKSEKGISPFRALSASLSGTLGVGNIVGVAVALIIGGSGAVFWIWVSAVISMILKYCEIVLGVKYRIKDENGFHGGPMYYMEKGISGRTGKICAVLFSSAGVVSSFALGNIVQISAASDAAKYIFGVPEIVFGISSAVIMAFVIFGGFDRISRVTSIVLPAMGGLYFVLSLAIIIKNAGILPSVFSSVFGNAFKIEASCGGIMGFLLSKNVSEGIAKGAFSHESGSGTAPMAHSGAETDLPARQGLLGLIEVTIDTLVICTLSAFVVLIAWEKGIFENNGMALVLSAFESGIGSFSKYAVGLAILLFVYSTVICWAYYGKSCLGYLTSSKKAATAYVIIYLFFIVFGAVFSQKTVWFAADAGVAVMTMLNLPSLIIMRKEIKRETETIF